MSWYLQQEDDYKARFSLSTYSLMIRCHLSTFIKSGSTVFHLGINTVYTLKYGTTEKFVTVVKHVRGDEDFQFIFQHPPGYRMECTDPDM